MKKNLNIEFSVRRFAAQDILTASTIMNSHNDIVGQENDQPVYGDIQERNVFRYLAH